MSYQSKTCIGLLVMALTIISGIAQADIITDMTGHWALDETGTSTVVTNSVGTDGTRGSVVENGQTGVIGTAYKLDGASNTDKVDTNMMLASGNSDFTLSTWVQTSYGEFGNYQHLISGNNAQDGRANFVITPAGKIEWFTSSTANGNFALQSTLQWFEAGTGTGGGEPVVDTDEWRFVAITRSNNACTIWVDGMQASDTVTNTNPINNSALTWCLGGIPYMSGTQGVHGYMDDAASWSRALSGAEIAAVAGLGEFSAVAASDSQIDDILTLSTIGASAVAGSDTWYYTDTFVADANSAALTAGMHYTGTDGEKYIILGDDSGFYGVTTAAAEVPEPSTAILLLGLAMAGFVLRRK